MNLIRKIFPALVIIFFMSFGLLTEAFGVESVRPGDKSLCKSGKQERSVQIQYFEQDRQVPCEVHYYKNSEESAMGQVLWRAANEVGFCEKKMAVFVEDLSNLGWDCQKPENSQQGTLRDTPVEMKDSRDVVLPPDLSSE